MMRIKAYFRNEIIGNKRKCRLFANLPLLAVVSWTCPLSAQTYTVAPGGSNITDFNGGNVTLDQIDFTNGSGDLTIDNSVSTTGKLNLSNLSTGNIVINAGQNVTVSGSSNGVFYIGNRDFTISGGANAGLILDGNTTNDFIGGGGLRHSGDKALVVDVDFKAINNGDGNVDYGGAVLSIYGTVAFQQNAVFDGNQVWSGGGAVAVHTDIDGTGLSFAKDVTLKNNKVLSQSGAGGALQVSGAIQIGGDIVAENNRAGGYGGAIYTVGQVNIAGDASFVGNKVDGVGAYLSPDAWTDFYMGYAGGAIYAFGVNTATGDDYVAAVNIDGRAIFQNNSVHAADDGHLVVAGMKTMGGLGGAIFSYSTVNLNGGADLTGNQAASSMTGSSASDYGNGGAIFVEKGDINIDAAQAGIIIQDNLATTNGGALYALTGDIHLTGSMAISGNEAQQGYGGAMVVVNGTAVIDGFGAITNNEAGSEGGAIAAMYGDISVAANGGDLIFSGNLNSASERNAIHIENLGNRSKLNLDAIDGANLIFEDSINSNLNADAVTVSINSQAGVTSSSTVLLDGEHSKIFANTVVDQGRLELRHDAIWGAVNARSSFALNADATLAGQGTIVAATNHISGTIDPFLYVDDTQTSYGALTIKGDYYGDHASLVVDTYLGSDGSASDRLIIDGGEATGMTLVTVRNTGGPGAATMSDGIKLVRAINGGKTAVDAFALNPNQAGAYQYKGQQAVVVDGSAYAYMLYRGGVSTGATDVYGENNFADDWYLRSTYMGGGGDDQPLYKPSTALYESYPQILLLMNRMETLQQRIGNLQWNEEPSLNNDNAARIEARGFWSYGSGSHHRYRPDSSTSGARFNADIWRFQAGFEGVVREQSSGVWIGGIYGHYVTASTGARSRFGKGDVDVDGYGIGATLTYYQDDRFYLDLHARATWYNADLNTKTGRSGAMSGNDGFGYALSAEMGRTYRLNERWALVPQAQLVWSSVDFDSFEDSYDTRISLKSGNSLEGRLGLALSHEKQWISSNGDKRRSYFYAVGNLYYEFLDGTKVDISGVAFHNRPERFNLGLGLGGTYDWHDGRHALYGEVNGRTGLNNFADSYSLEMRLGFRARF